MARHARRRCTRVVVIVLDSCGIGAAPDAARYGDEGSSTLPHTAAACGGLRLPVLGRLGLGRLAEIAGLVGFHEFVALSRVWAVRRRQPDDHGQ